MSKLDELVNDYILVGDDGAVIFSSFDKLLDFIDEIRADEREACAVVCENMERNGAWITKAEAAAALRQALAHEALDRMVAENQRLGLYENTPAVKSYCGGKPNYCTPEVTPEVTWDASAPLVLDCPRCGHCCQKEKNA